MNFRLSAIALIAANMVPLAGVLWLDWAVFDIMILYWAENVVIGVINVLRMLTCWDKTAFFIIPFFIVHYGMFCFGHYSAVTSLFGDGHWQRPLWIGVAAIALSHLVSFFVNFVAQREYERTSPSKLMQRPYGRIIILHVTIIAGAFLVTTLDNPFWMLPVLVAVKTAIDLRMHLAERKVFTDPGVGIT